MGEPLLVWNLFPNIKVLFQGFRMHALTSASGQSRKQGMPHFNLKVAQRMLQLLRGFTAWECQPWWIRVKAEACHLHLEFVMNLIVLYVFEGLKTKFYETTRSKELPLLIASQPYWNCICGSYIWSKRHSWLQVANSGGPMRNRHSWERSPRETDGTSWSWETRRVGWFTWRCTTGRARKVSRLTHINTQIKIQKQHTNHIHLWYLNACLLLVVLNIQEETRAK